MRRRRNGPALCTEDPLRSPGYRGRRHQRQLVAYFIILTTATTLFGNPHHHGGITTAADAAQALVYVLGPFARYLFSIGLIGADLVAIPVLLANTSYAVAGTFGWPVGLSKKPWQNEGFYLILTVALLFSLGMALLRLDPIKLIFWQMYSQGYSLRFWWSTCW